MNIALIADDRKKQLMIEFCLAHAGTLSRHELFATGATGKLVEDVTGLKVNRFMPGRQGGDQQIASRVAHGEIDLLIYFRDTLAASDKASRYEGLFRLCDTHDLPYATNFATAGIILYALEKGVLENIGKPRRAQ